MPMTHDELSKKLEGLWHDSFKAPGYQALTAIVELHKPTDNYAGNVCGYCFSLAYESTGLSMDYEDYAYPCPTIQAIEKELS